MYTIYQKQLMLYFYFILGELFFISDGLLEKFLRGWGIFELRELLFVQHFPWASAGIFFKATWHARIFSDGFPFHEYFFRGI